MKKLILFTSIQLLIAIPRENCLQSQEFKKPNESGRSQFLYSAPSTDEPSDPLYAISSKLPKQRINSIAFNEPAIIGTSANSSFAIQITATGTTNDAGCNPAAADIDAALGTATASSDCGEVTLTSVDGTTVISGCSRSRTRSWTATDPCGSFASTSRTVTWKEDGTPPTINATGTTNDLGCNPTSSDTQAALGSATASDNCEFTLMVADGPLQSSGCNRSQTRTWTATDICGNATVVSRTVTWIENTSSPIGTVSGSDPNLGCNPGAAAIEAALGTATVNETCGAVTLTVVTEPVVANGCSRSQTRRFTAIDNCGRFAVATRTATWIVDLVPPNISGASDITQPADPGLSTAQVNIVAPLVSDNCGIGAITSTRSDNLALTDPYPVGITTISWTATDICGNATVRLQTITITDLQAPAILSCPSLTPQCFTGNSSYTIPVLIASDNSGTPSISYVISGATSREGTGSDATGLFNPGTSIIQWTASDAAGNSVSCLTTVVIDKIDVSIPDTYAEGITPAIGSANTIYIGYGGTSITLTANIEGSVDPNSFSYKWTIGSPGGEKIGSGPTLTITPTTTTTYYLSVKDQNDCKQIAQVSKQITVNDIRCGAGKVFMCEAVKNGGIKTVCVMTSKVSSAPAGSTLGQCTGFITSADREEASSNKPHITSDANLPVIRKTK